jgi:High potential iron-sulfur protein
MKSPLSPGSESADAAAVDRRRLLTIGMRASFALAFFNSRTVLAASCTDPDDLSGADIALRKSVEYTETSPDEKKTCRGCGFFKGGSGGCGSCQILGGLVSAAGHCTSWSARAAVP